jgi:hypothetical protein
MHNLNSTIAAVHFPILRLAPPILRHSHVERSKGLRESFVLERGAHDQYATTGENWHVIEKMNIYPKYEEAARMGGLCFESCKVNDSK